MNLKIMVHNNCLNKKSNFLKEPFPGIECNLGGSRDFNEGIINKGIISRVKGNKTVGSPIC